MPFLGFIKRGLVKIGQGFIQRLREWTRPNNQSLAGGAIADATRSRSELLLENGYTPWE